MKITKDIRRLTEQAGGSFEEDFGRRDMRKFQLVAPYGQVWRGNDCKCIPVDWASGRTPHAVAFNESAFSSITEILRRGLRDMTEEEKYFCAED